MYVWLGISIFVNVVLLLVLAEQNSEKTWLQNKVTELKTNGMTNAKFEELITALAKQARITVYYMLLYLKVKNRAFEFESFSKKLFYRQRIEKLEHTSPIALFEEYLDTVPQAHKQLFTKRWWDNAHEPFISIYKVSLYEQHIEELISSLRKDL